MYANFSVFSYYTFICGIGGGGLVGTSLLHGNLLIDSQTFLATKVVNFIIIYEDGEAD